MNLNLKKLNISSNKNENWVSKTLKKRQSRPIVFSIVVISLILSYSIYNSYGDYDKALQKKEKVNNRISKYENLTKKVNEDIKDKEKRIVDIENLSVDSKRHISLLSKVCELLKKREVIGSFYIIKRQNKDFTNVVDIEIQVSYGDKDLLFLVTKIVLEKVFYLKDIKKTKKGLIAEVFNPVQGSN